jgi:tetratricopeptide (TPR) repeat protein
MEFRLGSAAFIIVFATYLFLGGMGLTDRGNPHPRDAPYNLLARGLASGHLYIAKDAPEFLRKLPNPYDPAANAPARDSFGYGLSDLSYYHGRMYMYFGAAPAVLVFLPWHILTGHWLPQWVAVVFLCAGGLLVNLSTIGAIRTRVFPGSAPWMAAVIALILGIGSYAPLLLSSADMWEVPVALGYLSVAIALRCLWQAYEHPEAPALGLGLASAAFGVAFASRPNELPSALILLFPFAIREIRVNARAWCAALIPVSVCGAGVALYNSLRFGSALEFGTSYMLIGAPYIKPHPFSPRYIWMNLRMYLVQPVDWSSVFPFAHESAVGPMPLGYIGTEHVSGVLVDDPILWLALALPFFFALRSPGRSFAFICVSAAWVALSTVGLLVFLVGANARYEFEFVPELAFLAALGVLALERLCASRLRGAVRWVWMTALGYSCAFSVLYGIERCVSGHNTYGIACIAHGDLAGAGREFETAKALSPRNPISRAGIGVLLIGQGRAAEARPIFEALVREYPDDPTGYLNLANVLAGEGRLVEAIDQYRAALRLDPGNAVIKANLETALAALARRRSR